MRITVGGGISSSKMPISNKCS